MGKNLTSGKFLKENLDQSVAADRAADTAAVADEAVRSCKPSSPLLQSVLSETANYLDVVTFRYTCPVC